MNNVSVEEMRKLINLISDDTLEATYIDKDMLNALNQYYMSLINYNNVLKQRIDKAIEYCEEITSRALDISDTDYDLGQDFTARDILKILRGEEDE